MTQAYNLPMAKVEVAKDDRKNQLHPLLVCHFLRYVYFRGRSEGKIYDETVFVRGDVTVNLVK